ncbi:MAG: GntR family transcriptional regulator, partial [Gammaproteobacteria bacterium]
MAATRPVCDLTEGKPARRCTNLVRTRLPWYVIYPECWGRSLGAAGRPAGAGGRAPRGHPGLWLRGATDVENPGGETGGTVSVIATLRSSRAAAAGQLALAPLNSRSLRDQAYALLKDAIANTDIYSERQPLRLDERELVKALGVSRTPVREALSILEQEGFVRTVPRRGIFIVRRSKREIIEMIQ